MVIVMSRLTQSISVSFRNLIAWLTYRPERRYMRGRGV